MLSRNASASCGKVRVSSPAVIGSARIGKSSEARKELAFVKGAGEMRFARAANARKKDGKGYCGRLWTVR